MIVEVISRRKIHDHASIASRSRFDWTAIVEFFHESSRQFDGASGKWTIAISRSSVLDREEGPSLDGDPPSDEDHAATHTCALLRIGRPIWVHVSTCGSLWMMLNLDR